MHQEEINPSLGKKSMQRAVWGVHVPENGFVSHWQHPYPGDTRRFRGSDTTTLGWLFLLYSMKMWASGWRNGLYSWMIEPLSRVVPRQCSEQHGRPRNTQNIANNNGTFHSGYMKSTWKLTFFLGKFQQSAVEFCVELCDCTAGRLWTHRLTPAWRNHSPGTCTFSLKDPCTHKTPCQRVWAEPKTMGLAWEVLWLLQH